MFVDLACAWLGSRKYHRGYLNAVRGVVRTRRGHAELLSNWENIKVVVERDYTGDMAKVTAGKYLHGALRKIRAAEKGVSA